MNVVVIGGAGFIGPIVVRQLIDRGNLVAVFHRGETKTELPPSVEQILGDRMALADHAAAFRRLAPDVVVDMIAFTELDALDLVATFRGIACRSVVISSADVYRAYGRFINLEPGPVEPTPLGEDAPLRSILFPYRAPGQTPDDFVYSYDKIPVERIVLSDPELPGTVLRLPMVHGPGDRYTRLSPYLKRMDDRRPAIVLDEGLARWRCPRGFVDNVAAAVTLAVVVDRAAGRIYNVAEAVAHTEAEWVRAIAEVVGWPGEVMTAPPGRIPLPYRIEQSLDTDSTRIRAELGYADVVDGRDALKRSIAWEWAHAVGPFSGIGLLGYDTEDALLAEIGRG
jgi:nucleoside-diphosphate-sugar epimerase